MDRARPSCRKPDVKRRPQSGAVRISVGPALPCATPSARIPVSSQEEVRERVERHPVERRVRVRTRREGPGVAVVTADPAEDPAGRMRRGGRHRRQEGHEVGEEDQVLHIIVHAGNGVAGEQAAVALRAALLREDRRRIPISFRYGSPEKVRIVATWFFQPKRPMRLSPPPMSTIRAGRPVGEPGLRPAMRA